VIAGSARIGAVAATAAATTTTRVIGAQMSDADDDPDRLVLSERAAVEVLAYLISAARTQVDEAAEYGPMRLLTAAQRLGDHLAATASPPVHQLLTSLATMAPTATVTADRDGYVDRLDALGVALADCLLAIDPPTSR
jgi:hypothetical protein